MPRRPRASQPARRRRHRRAVARGRAGAGVPATLAMLRGVQSAPLQSGAGAAGARRPRARWLELPRSAPVRPARARARAPRLRRRSWCWRARMPAWARPIQAVAAASAAARGGAQGAELCAMRRAADARARARGARRARGAARQRRRCAAGAAAPGAAGLQSRRLTTRRSAISRSCSRIAIPPRSRCTTWRRSPSGATISRPRCVAISCWRAPRSRPPPASARRRCCTSTGSAPRRCSCCEPNAEATPGGAARCRDRAGAAAVRRRRGRPGAGALDDALARFPGHPDLLYQKAIVLEKAGRTDEAIAQLEALYRERPAGR